MPLVSRETSYFLLIVVTVFLKTRKFLYRQQGGALFEGAVDAAR
jgi:hypothetical protein